MIRTMNAELKKMVSRPGIFVLAVLLAIILVFGVVAYNPTAHKETKSIQLEGSTFTEMYADFLGDGENSGYKVLADDTLSDAILRINSYRKSGLTIKETMFGITDDETNIGLIGNYNAKYKEFLELRYRDKSEMNQSYIDNCKNSFIDSLKDIDTLIRSGISANSKNAYTIISTSDNYTKYSQLYEDTIALFETDIDTDEISDEFEADYKSELMNCINSFIFPNISDELIESYTNNVEGSKLSLLNQRLTDINTNIEELQTAVNDDSSKNSDLTIKNKMNKLANDYVLTVNTYVELINLELLNNAFSSTKTEQQLNLFNLKNKSSYNTKSQLIRYSYLFENDKNSEDFANPLTIDVTSNHESNAYDYAYFILKLFSFIIIVYAVMCMCHSISGEIKEGTMRYLAIRPIKRSTLLFGKMLAIIVMSLILIVFSTIIAMCVGGAVYGFETLNILTIFNGQVAIIIHPIAMIIIYIFSLMLELIVYVSIAMLLSCLLKSDLLGVTIMIVLYLLNILLPVFAGGINSWLTFYPFSHISLYALFGSSIYLDPSNMLSSLLGSHVYAGTGLCPTLLIIFGFIIIFTILANLCFKKKEL